MKNKSYEIRAEVEIPAAGAEGVLVTQGGRFAGYSLYLLEGKLVYDYNLVGVTHYRVVSKERIPPDKHTVTADFKYAGGGIGKGGDVVLSVDGKAGAVGRVEHTLAFRLAGDETLDIGEDTGTPISDEYSVPFRFTGTLKKLVITLGESQLSAADRKAIDEAKAKIGLSE